MRPAPGVLAFTMLASSAFGVSHAHVADPAWVTVTRVIDGDTIDAVSGGRIRLLGIDAPELGGRYEHDAPFAREARDRLAGLVLRRSVRLEFDQERRDDYGRSLAYVLTGDGVVVNTILVRDGLARVSARRRLARLDELQRAEDEARRWRRGLWGSPPPAGGNEVRVPRAPALRSGTAPTRHCEGTTADGRPCRRRVPDGQRYCWQHREKGGVARARPRGATARGPAAADLYDTKFAFITADARLPGPELAPFPRRVDGRLRRNDAHGSAGPRDPRALGCPRRPRRAATGTLWKVKLGPEAQAETVATRLAWAMGYFAEGAYYRKQFEVRNLPALSRGRESQAGRTITRARFERVPGGDTGSIRWDWAWNPFVGSRELEGLKVLMMLLAYYDARAGNNRIELRHEPGGRLVARYLVSDLGATPGAVGGMGGRRSKNDLGDFARAPFVTGVDGGLVTFAYRTRPTGVATLMAVIYPPYFMGEVKKQRDMNGVPLRTARWIGDRLTRLTERQWTVMFDAADYDAAIARGYIEALRGRVAQLQALK